MALWGTVASDGQNRTCIAASATGQIVIAASSVTPNLGIGISRDFGLTWTYSNTSQAYSGVAVTSDGLTFFASFGNTIVKSTNGTTWSNFYTGLPAPINVMTRDGVHICGNQFYTGTSGSTANIIQSIAVYYATGNATNKWLSVTNSTSFTPLNPNTFTGYIPGGFTNTAYSSYSLTAGVYTSGAISTDGTKAYLTWSPANSNVGVIFVNTSYGTNNVWTAPSPSGLNWGAINRGFVTCSADGTKVLLIADANYISTDSGATFVKQTGSPAMTRASISDDGTVVHGVNGATLVMMSPTALFSSPSVSTTNIISNSAQPVWGIFGDGHNHTEVAASASGRVIVAGSNQTTNNLGIAVSRDYGMTWAYYTSAYTTNIPVTSLAVSADGSTFVAGTGGTGLSSTILVSTDGGASWAAHGGGINLPTVMCKTPSVITTNNYQSTDGGVTFVSRISSEGQILAASADGAILLATFVSASVTPVNSTTGKGSCLSVSYNRGGTWTNIVSALFPSDQYSFSSAVMSADGNKMAAIYTVTGNIPAYGAVIALSSDAGVTWTRHNFTAGGGYLSGLNCSADGLKFVVTYAKLLSGTWSTTVYNSIDGGTTWQILVGYPGPTSALDTTNTISDDGLCIMEAWGGPQLTTYLSHPFFATTGTSSTNAIGLSWHVTTGISSSPSTTSGVAWSTAVSTGTSLPASSTDGVGFRYVTVWTTGTSVSNSTTNIIGWIQRYGTFTSTSSSTTNLVGASRAVATGSSTSVSGSAGVGASFCNEPFTSVSTSTTAFIGSSIAVATGTSTSASSTAIKGSSVVSATYSVIGSSVCLGVGSWLQYTTGTAFGTSSTNGIGSVYVYGQFTSTSPSSTSGVGSSKANSPFTSVSASSTNGIGGAMFTGVFTSVSASTSLAVGLITRAGIFASTSLSGSNFRSALLANVNTTLARPVSKTIGIFNPKPITGLVKAVLATLSVKAVATYTPGPIFASIGRGFPKPLPKAVAGAVPPPITSDIDASIPRPVFRGSSALTSALNCYLWGVQIENEAGVTSYIPTAGASVARAPDMLNITTSDSPYVVTMDALILCSLAQAILDYTPQTSNEAADILNQYINLFDTTIAPASNLGWIPTVSALTKLRTTVLQYLQQQIAVEPAIQVQSFGDQVPDVVAAYAIYGDATRANELVASNDPVNPLFMPTRISYNNS